MNIGISLYDLQNSIKECVGENFPQYYWVRGEVSAIKANYSGHCYIDLIDKGESESDIRAKGHAIVWASKWRVLNPYFQTTTGSPISAGMNILVKVQPQFSELYGLSLIISDIDPSYTIGEAELQRREVIKRLREEGMFDMNTTLSLPPLPRRFAVISSESAAGYRDFQKHLHLNEYGYKFTTKLYSAPMQGGAAPAGIVEALEEIIEDYYNEGEKFDAVLIIRGGGSATDLACFDDYHLCANIAQFPLPIMVAVGHDQDHHIADMVACVSVKTPTALANFLIDIFATEDAMLSSLATRITLSMNNKFADAKRGLDSIKLMIEHRVSSFYREKNATIALLEQRITKGDPSNLLKGGYCVSEVEGRRITSALEVKPDVELNVVFEDGVVECKVEKVSCRKVL